MAGDVKFKFTGDSSELRSELKKVEKNLNGVAGAVQGTTNRARKGLDGLGKSVQSTGKTAQGAANNNRAFNDSLKDVKDNAGETASIMGGLATSISVISPQAGAAVRALGDLATGVEAASRGGSRLFAILGPVGVAIAAAGAAYVALKGDLDEANEALETNRKRLEDVESISQKVKEAVLIAAHAELEAALATGKATQAQVDASRAKLDDMAIAQKSTDLFSARREALEEEKKAIEDQIDAQKTQTKERITASTGMSVMLAAHAAGTQAHKDSTEATSAEATELQNLQHQLQLANNQLMHLDFTQEEYESALKATNEAQKKTNDSTKDGTDKQKAHEEALKATADALAFLQSKNEAALVSQLNERHKILHSYQREIEAIQEVARQHTGNAEITAAADEAHHNRSIQAMRELDALDAENAEKRKQRQEEIKQKELQTLQTSLSNTAGILGSVSDLYGISAQKRSETDKKGAMKAFKVQQGLAKAAVTVDYFQSLMAAMKSGNPAQIIMQSTAASLMYAVSLAKINAQRPSFHSGTGLVRAPSGVSEMNARLRGGEAVSTPLGAELIGRSNIERANAGIRPNNGSNGVSFQYEHRVFSQFIRDNIRSRGPLGREHDRKRHVGHRS